MDAQPSQIVVAIIAAAGQSVTVQDIFKCKLTEKIIHLLRVHM